MPRWISTAISARIMGLVLLRATCAFAQISTANVAGIVEDSTAARLPDATVKLINSQTGTENDSKTNRFGIFLLPGVIPGIYTLQIEREGFATSQFTGLLLNVGDTKSILIRMQLGTVTQTVHIDASGVTPNAADASVSTIVNRGFVANTPLNGRSFQDLVSMTPGIVTQTPQTFGAGYGVAGDFSVNGQQPDRNSYFIDGVSGDIGVGLLVGHTKFASSGNAAGTTALGTTQSLVSIDDLQEFRVLTSNYSAEYGRTSGGQFTLLTRSGTDKYHGSLYDYVRNNAADAADWFTKFNSTDSSLPYQQNDFGGAVGGPFGIPGVYSGHSKTFFFVSYEGLHVTEPTAPLVEYVPSEQTFAAAPAPLRPILEAFPPPYQYQLSADAPPASTGLSPFVPGTLSEPGSINSTSIRLDHPFSPKISAFIRSSFTPSESESNRLASLTTNHVDTQTDTLGATFQLSGVITNEFRLGYGVSTSLLNTALSIFWAGGVFGNSDLNTNLGIPAGSFPLAAADVYIHSAGAGDSEINTDEAFGSVHQWNVRDTFALQTGHQLLQFGIDQRHLVSKTHPAALNVEADFFNPQSILANSASDIAITKSLPAAPVFNQYAAFIQDAWQASKSLTISAGLRWEVDPAPQGKHGADAYTLLGNPASPSELTLAPRGTRLWDTSWLNLAPRAGAAWIVDRRSGRELVVRVGGGIFYDTDDRAAAPAFSALGFSATEEIVNMPVPVTVSQLDFSPAPAAPYTNSPVFTFPRHLQLPYTIQWNVAVEKALGRSQTFTATYVGDNARRLLQAQRTNINNENSEFGEVYFFPADITSNYQALQLKFQRSISPGIQALASYVWSHTLDYGSTDPAWTLTRGNSDLDVRHNLEVALSWDERDVSGGKLRKYVLGGWGADGRLTARTAFPMTPLGNPFSDPATGNRYFSGVDMIPGQPLYISGSRFPGGRMLNGGPYAADPAFVLPALNSAGNTPRNMLRGFGDNQINVAVRREIHVKDSLNLQLRGETYNLFNHPDLGYIDSSLTDALFGQSTLMLNQSFGPTGSLYQPGGPRSIQISVRFHF
jgi:hypothetical protein